MALLNLTDKDYSNTIKNETIPVIVQFHAEWCGPCKMVSPIIEEYGNENDEALVIRVDCDQSPQIAAFYGVRNIPTTILLGYNRHTNEYDEVDKIVGATSKEVMIEKFDSLVMRHPQQEKPKIITLTGEDKWYEPLDLEELELVRGKFITHIRRFRLAEDVGIHFKKFDGNPGNSANQHNRRFVQLTGRAGDIVEEIFNCPNSFLNVSLIQRELEAQRLTFKDLESLKKLARPFSVYDYNRMIQTNYDKSPTKEHIAHSIQGLLNVKKSIVNWEPIESIDVKDSELLKTNYCAKKTLTSLKRKVKAVANLNEEVTMLKHILGE